MNVEDRMGDLLLRWQQEQAQGRDVSAAELCHDCPELIAELEQQIELLRHMNAMLGSGSQTDVPSVNDLAANVQTGFGNTLPAASSTKPAPTLPGYEILGELGRGGMGVVYKARQHKLNRIVALKMILSGVHAGADATTRFLQEAETIARLQHANIVQVYEFGSHEGNAFFSLEFIEGGSLADRLKGEPQPPMQAARLVETLARAMQTAHDAKIVHRDLKPANVLMSGDGAPKVTDFGLAKQSDSGMTATGAVMGTPSYMAPEQAEGKTKEVSPAADIYALGAILYEMLTGRPPFKGVSAWDTVQMVVSTEPAAPRQLNAQVPRDLETICLKCLQKQPGKRYGSALELAEDLRRYQAGEPVVARPVSALERGWRWCKRNPVVAGLLTMVAVTLVAGAATATGFAIKADRALVKEEQVRKDRALAQVNALLKANPQGVADLLAGLEPFREDVLPRLRELWEEPDQPDKRLSRMRAALALLPVDPDAVKQPLFTWMFETPDPQEMLLVRDRLRPHQTELKAALWQKIDAAPTNAETRFRALVALAAFDPHNPRWREASKQVVSHWLEANSLHLGLWNEALRPVRDELLAPLSEAFRNGEIDRRPIAANILADYTQDRIDLLIDLLLVADERQYTALRPAVHRQRDKALTFLKEELTRVAHTWKDPPLVPAWVELAPATRQQIAAAQGLVAERYAFCQTLPLEQYDSLAQAMRKSGYRPTQFRPYTVGNDVQVAAVWTRDGKDWRTVSGLTPEEIHLYDTELRKQGLVPIDVASYLIPAADRLAVRHAGLWAGLDAAQEVRLYVGVAAGKEHVATRDLLQKTGFVSRTEAQLAVGKEVRHSGIWWKRPPPFARTYSPVNINEAWYEDYLRPSLMQVDVRLSSNPKSQTSLERSTALLAQADMELKANPKDRDALHRRGMVHYWLGQDEQALADLDAAIGAGESTADMPYAFRALVHARLGNEDKSRKDRAEFQRRTKNESTKLMVRAMVFAYSGDDEEGFKSLEASIVRDRSSTSLYNAARAYAVAARVYRKKPGVKATVYADRSVALLKEAIERGYNQYGTIQTDPDLDELRQHPGYLALLRQGFEHVYSGVWENSSDRVSLESHGLSPEAHLTRCREFASQGCRIVALSVFQRTPGAPPATASVWHRPFVPEAATDALAKRQAQAAVALLQLGEPDLVWPLLKHSPDPSLRTWLVHSLARLNTDPKLLLQRLEEKGELDVSARRALVLGLGAYSETQLPIPVRQKMLPRLLADYEKHPDPGLHSAIEWLLRRWKHGQEIEHIDNKLRGVQASDRHWYVNKEGQTLAVVRGPTKFLMGSFRLNFPNVQYEPIHPRRMPRSFAIATKEVTAAEFKRFLKDHPQFGYSSMTELNPNKDDPVRYVSWYWAVAYCNWLSKQDGIPKEQWCYPDFGRIGEGMQIEPGYLKRQGYRLPTEAEWEYACRAGALTSRFYGSSESLLKEYAWYAKTTNSEHPLPVGQLQPNDLGLFDVYGNVREWVHDPNQSFAPRLVSDDEHDLKAVTSMQTYILRGGHFAAGAAIVRSSDRSSPSFPSATGNTLGLRVARTCD